MNEIKEYINNYNIISTKSIEKLNNSVSIFSIIYDYNTMYNEYKNEFSKLPELKISDEIEFDYYCESKYFDFRMVKLLLHNKTNIDKHIIFTYQKDQSNYGPESIKNNNDNSITEYTKGRYIEFGKKYSNFISYSNKLKMGFNREFNNVLINIQLFGNIPEENNYILVRFGMEQFDYEIKFKLGENFKISEAKSLNINNNITNEQIIELAKNIFINRDYLTNLDNSYIIKKTLKKEKTTFKK